MESIKSTLRSALQSTYGECTLVMGENDRGFSICIHKYKQHVIYIRPDERETHYLCHYAHREDLERTADDSKEREEWKQQAVFQLPRRYDGGLKKYVQIAMKYVQSATERMELYRDIDGRGLYHRIKSFAEAAHDQRSYPKPKRPDPVLPPPVCRRHNDVHREALKRKRLQEAVAEEVNKRQKREEACVWRP